MMIEKPIIERIKTVFEVLDNDNEEGFGITASGYRISITKRDQGMHLDVMDIKYLHSVRKIISRSGIATSKFDVISVNINRMIAEIENQVVETKENLAKDLTYCFYCGSTLEDERKKQVERYLAF